MFIKINDTTVINLEQIAGIELIEHDKGYLFQFIVGGSGKITNEIELMTFSSKNFSKKEEALEWFQDNIEPYIKDYNNTRLALIDLNHLYDISKDIEAIAVILEELKKERG